jgi:predicted CXXCH cytochrome family protein
MMDRRKARKWGATIFVLGCTASLLAVAAPAAADNGPHVKGAGAIADSCASCHRVHTANAPRLLKESQTTLCYSCHGAAATGANTDVVDGVGYSGAGRTGPTGALRGGGFAYALIGSGSPEGNGYLGEVPVRSAGAAVTSTHSVDESEQRAWGNGAISATADYGKVIPLRCGSCHDPHGNGNYRILRPMPKDAVVRPKGSTAGDVVIPDTATKVYTTDNYWQVEDVNAPGFITSIAAWCATCHTRYLSSSGGGSTDSGDAVFAYRHRSDQAAQGSANCIQCHVSHGSNASMGTYSAGVANPDGSVAGADSRLLRIDSRGVCQMCHDK